jgi:hypothetical protein
MWTILQIEGAFWQVHSITASLATAGLLVLYCKARSVFAAVPRQLEKNLEENQSFVFLGYAHLICQFFEAFIYNFSLLTYLSRFLLFTEVFSFSYTYMTSVQQKIAFRNAIDFFQKLILYVSLVIFFASVLKIKSKNQCGQIYTNLYFTWYGIAGVLAVFCCVRNMRALKEKLKKLQRQASSGTSLRNSIEVPLTAEPSHSVLEYYSSLYTMFLLSALLSCFGKAVLLWFEMSDFRANGSECDRTFHDKGLLFQTVFALASVLCTNAINILIIKIYYWDVRGKLRHIILNAVDSKPKSHHSFLKMQHEKAMGNFKSQIIKEEESGSSEYN